MGKLTHRTNFRTIQSVQRVSSVDRPAVNSRRFDASLKELLREHQLL